MLEIDNRVWHVGLSGSLQSLRSWLGSLVRNQNEHLRLHQFDGSIFITGAEPQRRQHVKVPFVPAPRSRSNYKQQVINRKSELIMS